MQINNIKGRGAHPARSGSATTTGCEIRRPGLQTLGLSIPLIVIAAPGSLAASVSHPSGRAISALERYAATLTSNGGPNLISVFHGSTCNATATSGCGQTPANAPTGPDDPVDGSTESVAVNAATNTIYATSDTLGNGKPFLGHTVYVIGGPACDAADMAGCGDLPATISVGSDPVFGDANPFGIAVDEATDTIYTANIFNREGPGTVSVINGATCNSQNTSGCDQTPAVAPAGFGANGIAVDHHQPRLRHQHQGHQRHRDQRHPCNSRIPTGCNDTQTRAIVGEYPSAISVDPAAGTAYVADIEGVSVMPLTHDPRRLHPLSIHPSTLALTVAHDDRAERDAILTGTWKRT